VDNLEFELLENGLDFISSGLDCIVRGDTKSDLKYGVLHLASGIDLILKERLRLKHWTLVFKDPKVADIARYKSGNFISVDHRECIRRLEDDCGIELSQEAKDSLLAFRGPRNRLEHFAIVDTKTAIESLAAPALTVLLDFVSDNFDHSQMSDRDKRLLLDIRERLGHFDTFVNQRLEGIFALANPRRPELAPLIQCPCCLQPTLTPDVDVECLFCGYRATCEDAANLFVAHHGASTNIGFCPQCENESFVDLAPTGNAAPSIQFVCFGCGSKWDEGELEICELCHQPESRDYMTPRGCRECYGAYVSSEHS
jgi:hypothetical protein